MNSRRIQREILVNRRFSCLELDLTNIIRAIKKMKIVNLCLFSLFNHNLVLNR